MIRQKIGGALMSLVGLGFVLWSWHTARHEGYYYPKAVLIMPGFVVVGMALVFFQGYREERLARGEDISQLKGWDLLTPRWKILAVVALAAGIGHFLAFRWLFGK